MGFRDEFWLTKKTYAEWSLENTTQSGFQSNQEKLTALQKQVKSTFEQGIARLVERQDDLKGEIAYQSERISEQVLRGSWEIVSKIEHSSANIVNSIQKMSDYLGSELCEIRWAVERQTEVSEAILKTMLNSVNNDSRQYFEQGVKCYEMNEYEFAKERFNKALELNRTNHFVYQYLGFLAVKLDSPDEAIRNFDLARKFAESEYHEALALSHLARSYYALNNLSKTIDLAGNAAKICDKAKFWYDFAAYNTQAGYKTQAISALRQAIERDWAYWAVVATDQNFDPMRLEVNQLLNEIREQEKKKAQSSLDSLKRVREMARQVGVEEVTRMATMFYDNLAEKIKQNNVFIFQEIVPEANRYCNEICQRVTKHIQEQISQVNEKINKLDSDSGKEASAFYDTLDDLKRDRDKYNYKKMRPSGGEYLFIIIIAGIPISALFLMFGGGADYGCLTGFIISLLLPSIRNLIRCTIPQYLIESKIEAERNNINKLSENLNSEYNRKKSNLHEEIKKLEKLSEQAKIARYN